MLTTAYKDLSFHRRKFRLWISLFDRNARSSANFYQYFRSGTYFDLNMSIIIVACKNQGINLVLIIPVGACISLLNSIKSTYKEAS